MTTEYELHEYATLFPKMTDAEFSALVADVKEHGVREPITLFDGKVIEGRHRMLAAKEAGVDLPIKVFEGDDAEALALVASANLARRHLTDDQRARVAAKIANMRQGERTDLTPTGAKISQSKASDMMKVPLRTTQRAKVIIDHGSEELNDLHERGEVSTSAAEIVAKLPEPEQLAIVEQGPAAIVEAAAKAREPEGVDTEGRVYKLIGVDAEKNIKRIVKGALTTIVLKDDGEHDAVKDLGTTLDVLASIFGDVVEDYRGKGDLFGEIAKDAA